MKWLALVVVCGCAQTGGAVARVQAGCPERMAISVTVGGSVEIQEGSRIRRTVVKSEQREDLDRLVFSAGAPNWPACAGDCGGLRYVTADGLCHQATREVVASGPGQSLVALLGDIVEAEMGAGRRAQ